MSALLTAGPVRQTRENDQKLAALAARCHYYMALMREAEDRIERKLYRQGKVVGGVYVGRGQEAIPVGSALHALPASADSPAAATATCTWATSTSVWCRLSARWRRPCL